MKKILLVLCAVSFMSGCVYWPHERGHGGYSRDDGGHREGDRSGNRGGEGGRHGGEHGHGD